VQTAVLDACVLFRNGVRDFLLWVAEAGAFTPVWSDTIHDEWTKSRHEKFGDPIGVLLRARAHMENAFPGSNFEPDDTILRTISLPDPGDVHVVATAIAAEATTIVTCNEKDFPDEILAPLGLGKEEPDVFCARLFSNAQIEVVEGARLHRASLKKPRYDQRAYVEHVEAKLELKRTAQLLRTFQRNL
jgi:predicted nucleic acid-binding protein